MSNLGFIIGSAALTFTVTNIDVFCLLVLFFAKAKVDTESTNTNVWISQAIGFSVIVGVSLLGLVLSASVETQYVSLLGVIPILMGARSMYNDWDWDFIKQRICCRGSDLPGSKSAQLEASETVEADTKDVEMASASSENGDTRGSPTSNLTALDLTASTQGTGLEDLVDCISVMSDEPDSRFPGPVGGDDLHHRRQRRRQHRHLPAHLCGVQHARPGRHGVDVLRASVRVASSGLCSAG